MAEPWGISGPQFIILYLVAVLGTYLLANLLRATRGPQPPGPLTVDEVGFLHDGPTRVVFVAVANLIDSGALRVDREGKLQATGAAGRSALEQDILAFADRGPVTAQRVTREFKGHSSIVAIRPRLVARGLIRSNTFRQLLVAHLPMLAVFGIGIARLVNGTRLDRPTDLLWMALIGTAILLLVRLGQAGKIHTTKQGKDLLRSIRGFRADSHRRLPVAPLAGAAGLVAMGGIAAFPDQTISMALHAAEPIKGGGGSSCGGSSGSSCGSNSSCSSSSCSSGSSGGGSSCGG